MTLHKMNRRVALATVAGLALAAPTALHAEETLVEELVVTAQKREERLQDAALAVSAVSGDQLDRSQAREFLDYARRVPGLSLQGGGGAGKSQIVIRGVTTGPIQQSATVAQYFDEIPTNFSIARSAPALTGLDPSLFDIERIEVLNGPQGTLYGASALGGLLKVVTRAPDLSQPALTLQFSGADAAGGAVSADLRAMVNVPLTEQLGVRAVVYSQSTGGFVDDPARGDLNVNRDTSVGGRFAVRAEPNEDVTVTGTFSYQDIENDGQATADIDPTTGRFVSGERRQRRFVDESFGLELGSASLTAQVRLTTGELTATASRVTREVRDDVDYSLRFTPLLGPVLGLPVVPTLSSQSANAEKQTLEVRYAADRMGRFEWLAGVFYTTETARFGQVVGVPPVGLTVTNINNRSRYEELAGFARVTADLTDTIQLGAGARVTSVDQSFRQLANGAGFRDGAGSGDASKAIYSADARWRPSRNLTVYARAAQGYNPGAANLPFAFGAISPPTFTRPESLWNYEAGVKARLLDGRLDVTASAFRIDWDDIQVILRATNGATFMENAGKARNEGFEGSFEARPLAGLTVRGAVTYTDAKLTKADPLFVSGAAGDRLPGVPEWQGAASADYAWTVGEFEASLGVALTYVDDRPADFSRTPDAYTLKNYALLDLRMAVVRGPYELGLFARNLTDETPMLGIQQLGRRVFVGQPRTIGARVTARY